VEKEITLCQLVRFRGLSKEDKEEAKGLKLRLGYHNISAVYLYLNWLEEDFSID
jgi:hypothetical protein